MTNNESVYFLEGHIIKFKLLNEKGEKLLETDYYNDKLSSSYLEIEFIKKWYSILNYKSKVRVTYNSLTYSLEYKYNIKKRAWILVADSKIIQFKAKLGYDALICSENGEILVVISLIKNDSDGWIYKISCKEDFFLPVAVIGIRNFLINNENEGLPGPRYRLG